MIADEEKQMLQLLGMKHALVFVSRQDWLYLVSTSGVVGQKSRGARSCNSKTYNYKFPTEEIMGSQKKFRLNLYLDNL